MIYGKMGDLSDMGDTVIQTVKHLYPHRDAGEFESIVVSGSSGLIVGAPVALWLSRPLVIVRKPQDQINSHSSRLVENMQQLGARSLFLDDVIATGATRARVIKSVRQAGGHVVACYLYEEEGYNEKLAAYVRGGYHTGYWENIGERWCEIT